mmetsp:Transcript_54489/g.128614  ORF Transcript_54489/g.128614 Transcript_54489/m.128614 type:complete len:202 (+) Transcript_54489:967-1572(+)
MSKTFCTGNHLRPQHCSSSQAHAACCGRPGDTAVEASALRTTFFANQRGGSRPPRGRVVARMHRGMHLAAWEEECDDCEGWLRSDDEDRRPTDDAEEEEDVEDGSWDMLAFEGLDWNNADGIDVNGWLQPCPEQGNMAVDRACGAGFETRGACPEVESKSAAESNAGSAWEVPSKPDAKSAGSACFVRDLDLDVLRVGARA